MPLASFDAESKSTILAAEDNAETDIGKSIDQGKAAAIEVIGHGRQTGMDLLAELKNILTGSVDNLIGLTITITVTKTKG